VDESQQGGAAEEAVATNGEEKPLKITQEQVLYSYFGAVLRIRDVFSWIRKFFHPGSYMKSGTQTFLASYGFRSKVLVLVIVKKIRNLEKIHPGSRG
jgi:hypothetical protein